MTTRTACKACQNDHASPDQIRACREARTEAPPRWLKKVKTPWQMTPKELDRACAAAARRIQTPEAGYVLPVVIFAMLILSILMPTLVLTAGNDRQAWHDVKYGLFAHYAAEAGARLTIGNFDFPCLTTGEEATTEWLAVPGASRASRYRVTFVRTDQDYGRPPGIAVGRSCLLPETAGEDTDPRQYAITVEGRYDVGTNVAVRRVSYAIYADSTHTSAETAVWVPVP